MDPPFETELVKTALKISSIERVKTKKFPDGKIKILSKTSIFPNGDVKVTSVSEAANEAAWSFVRDTVLPCIESMKAS
jgi:hypothetical protein